MSEMREKLVNLIIERLDRDAEKIRSEFGSDQSIKARYCAD